MADLTNVTGLTACVTGGTGYLAGYLIKELLSKGYTIKTTVRSLQKREKYQHLLDLPRAAEQLLFFEADLSNESGWREAVKGCNVVFHVASPFTVKRVKDPLAELIDPAVAGVVNVLQACHEERGSVKHVILTSSIAAVTDQGNGESHKFTEADWNTQSSATRNPYYASKVAAERAAWEFVKSKEEVEGGTFALTAMLPGAIAGPFLCKPTEVGGGYQLMWTILDEQYPGFPRIVIHVTDVRDVAHAHVLAYEKGIQVSGGQRYIICGDMCSACDIGMVIKSDSRFKNYKIPSFELPDIVTSVASYFDQNVDRSFMATHLGKNNYDNYDKTKAKRDLGIEFTPHQEVILTVCNSLIEFGIVKDKRA